MKNIGYLLILLLFCCGCKKENPSEFSPNLLGEWLWITSCGGISYTCHTPKSRNYEVKLIFKPDSILDSYRNDTLMSSEKFQTYISPTSTLPGTPDVIKYSTIQMKFSVINDTLHFIDFCCDGYESTYKRKK